MATKSSPSRTADLDAWAAALEDVRPFRLSGHVVRASGLVIEAQGPPVTIGEICRVERTAGRPPIPAEVVGVTTGRVRLLPLGPTDGIEAGARVVATRKPLTVRVGPELLGRVVDAFGRPLDGRPLDVIGRPRAVNAPAPEPMFRRRVKEPLELGVRAIDGLITCGKGQRMGIFSGSGVGKSVLLGMIARNCEADVNVIALVGERGREVRDFVERNLAGALERSVVVVTTSDEPPLLRRTAAMTATTVAEYFREQGKHVLLIMDSITRVAAAQREAGLAAGEPPTTRGYPPSVFLLLPELLERAGNSEGGSITGLYAVLVEADDMADPVADAVRATLDGHIVLSRRLAEQGHYPAVDVLASVSRLMDETTSREHALAAARVRQVLSTYQAAFDLINIGAYAQGTDPRIDWALRHLNAVNQFLRQDVHERAPFTQTQQRLLSLFVGDESWASDPV
jgi:flagellum-specific ATP synthase